MNRQLSGKAQGAVLLLGLLLVAWRKRENARRRGDHHGRAATESYTNLGANKLAFVTKVMQDVNGLAASLGVQEESKMEDISSVTRLADWLGMKADDTSSFEEAFAGDTTGTVLGLADAAYTVYNKWFNQIKPLIGESSETGTLFSQLDQVASSANATTLLIGQLAEGETATSRLVSLANSFNASLDSLIEMDTASVDSFASQSGTLYEALGSLYTKIVQLEELTGITSNAFETYRDQIGLTIQDAIEKLSNANDAVDALLSGYSGDTYTSAFGADTLTSAFVQTDLIIGDLYQAMGIGGNSEYEAAVSGDTTLFDMSNQMMDLLKLEKNQDIVAAALEDNVNGDDGNPDARFNLNLQFQLYDFPQSEILTVFSDALGVTGTVAYKETIAENTTLANVSNQLSLPVRLGIQTNTGTGTGTLYATPNISIDLLLQDGPTGAMTTFSPFVFGTTGPNDDITYTLTQPVAPGYSTRGTIDLSWNNNAQFLYMDLLREQNVTVQSSTGNDENDETVTYDSIIMQAYVVNRGNNEIVNFQNTVIQKTDQTFFPSLVTGKIMFSNFVSSDRITIVEQIPRTIEESNVLMQREKLTSFEPDKLVNILDSNPNANGLSLFNVRELQADTIIVNDCFARVINSADSLAFDGNSQFVQNRITTSRRKLKAMRAKNFGSTGRQLQQDIVLYRLIPMNQFSPFRIMKYPVMQLYTVWKQIQFFTYVGKELKEQTQVNRPDDQHMFVTYYESNIIQNNNSFKLGKTSSITFTFFQDRQYTQYQQDLSFKSRGISWLGDCIRTDYRGQCLERERHYEYYESFFTPSDKQQKFKGYFYLNDVTNGSFNVKNNFNTDNLVQYNRDGNPTTKQQIQSTFKNPIVTSSQWKPNQSAPSPIVEWNNQNVSYLNIYVSNGPVINGNVTQYLQMILSSDPSRQIQVPCAIFNQDQQFTQYPITFSWRNESTTGTIYTFTLQSYVNQQLYKSTMTVQMPNTFTQSEFNSNVFPTIILPKGNVTLYEIDAVTLPPQQATQLLVPSETFDSNRLTGNDGFYATVVRIDPETQDTVPLTLPFAFNSFQNFMFAVNPLQFSTSQTSEVFSLTSAQTSSSQVNERQSSLTVYYDPSQRIFKFDLVRSGQANYTYWSVEGKPCVLSLTCQYRGSEEDETPGFWTVLLGVYNSQGKQLGTNTGFMTGLGPPANITASKPSTSPIQLIRLKTKEEIGQMITRRDQANTALFSNNFFERVVPRRLVETIEAKGIEIGDQTKRQWLVADRDMAFLSMTFTSSEENDGMIDYTGLVRRTNPSTIISPLTSVFNWESTVFLDFNMDYIQAGDEIMISKTFEDHYVSNILSYATTYDFNNYINRLLRGTVVLVQGQYTVEWYKTTGSVSNVGVPNDQQDLICRTAIDSNKMLILQTKWNGSNLSNDLIINIHVVDKLFAGVSSVKLNVNISNSDQGFDNPGLEIHFRSIGSIQGLVPAKFFQQTNDAPAPLPIALQDSYGIIKSNSQLLGTIDGTRMSFNDTSMATKFISYDGTPMLPLDREFAIVINPENASLFSFDGNKLNNNNATIKYFDNLHGWEGSSLMSEWNVVDGSLFAKVQNPGNNVIENIAGTLGNCIVSFMGQNWSNGRFRFFVNVYSMQGKLLAYIENSIPNNASTTHYVFDWPALSSPASSFKLLERPVATKIASSTLVTNGLRRWYNVANTTINNVNWETLAIYNNATDAPFARPTASSSFDMTFDVSQTLQFKIQRTNGTQLVSSGDIFQLQGQGATNYLLAWNQIIPAESLEGTLSTFPKAYWIRVQLFMVGSNTVCRITAYDSNNFEYAYAQADISNLENTWTGFAIVAQVRDFSFLRQYAITTSDQADTSIYTASSDSLDTWFYTMRDYNRLETPPPGQFGTGSLIDTINANQTWPIMQFRQSSVITNSSTDGNSVIQLSVGESTSNLFFVQFDNKGVLFEPHNDSSEDMEVEVVNTLFSGQQLDPYWLPVDDNTVTTNTSLKQLNCKLTTDYVRFTVVYSSLGESKIEYTFDLLDKNGAILSTRKYRYTSSSIYGVMHKFLDNPLISNATRLYNRI